MANLLKTGKDIHPFPQQDYKSNFKTILHSLKQTHTEKNIVIFSYCWRRKSKLAIRWLLRRINQ